MAPLSREQEQLWAQHIVAPEVPFNHTCAVTIRGPLDADVLRECLAEFTSRHQIWRTCIRSTGGRPVQLVQPQGQPEWSLTGLTRQPRSQRAAAALRLADEAAAQPFDLARGPLVRALLVRLGDTEHQLFVTLPQVISDRPSLAQVFLPELAALYQARLHGRAAGLDGPAQYADHAARQRDKRAEAEFGARLEAWRGYLAGAPTVLQLPRDHRRAGMRTYRAGMAPFALSERLSEGLRALSDQEQVPLRVTLTAAYAALLYRYTGQDDLLIGMTAPEPGQGPAARMMGCRAGTAVLRADLAGEPTVAELLRRTQEANEAVRGLGEVPLGALVEVVRPERGDGHPLVQVLLAFEPEPPELPAGWRPCSHRVCPAATAFELCLEIGERDGGPIAGRFVYNRDFFEPETIQRMIGHWQMALAGLAAEPSRRVGELELLPAAEKSLLLGTWSAGGEVSPGPGVVQLIAAQASARPEAVAVVCGGERLTYGELDRRAGRLARHLRRRGAGAETLIGVFLERSLDHMIALVAILKAGAAYVPLDPEAPPERTRYQIQDTAMALLLTRQKLRDRLSGAEPAVVSLDTDRDAIARESAAEPGKGPAAGERLAYVIYTSGSTGRPKGVMVTHGALAAHTRAVTAAYRLGPADRVLQFGQYSADASIEQILPALAAGGRLIVRGTEIWSPRQLLEELKRHQVTVMNLSPVHWQQVVAEWAREPRDLAGLRLRLVILGGERVGAAAVQRWRDLGLSGVRLLNAYGPTEATITATIGDAGREQDLITIGRPLAGRTVYVLDRGGRPVPAGILGELHIGGPLLARGYLNRPDLTKERFVPDTLGGRPDGRLYRTGDLVRYLPDGRIEYVGRKDHQVKIRGYRIELGEVEAALTEHPAVGEAVVATRGEGEDRDLVAYVVPRTAEPPAERELRQFLAGKLPAYMQPAAIAELADLPRLATGKPDRKRLPEITRAQRAADAGYRPPRLLIHQQLVQLWEELLAARPIGIADNFFHLGGHSLLAARLVDRIEQMYGTRLKLSVLFANPTIEQLAEVLWERQEPGEPGQVLPVQASGKRAPFFFLHGDWTGGAFYCFALARACGPQQPFYVLEPQVFSESDGAPSLEEVARAHIEAIRKVRPRGPYRLGGYCNGGLLAYEMASQLEQAGDQVEFLGLIDASPPVQSSLMRAVCQRINRARRVSASRQADLFLRARHAQRHIYRRLRPAGSRVRDFGQLLAIEPRLAAMFPPRQALYKDYIGVLTWAATGYRAGRYGGRISFYWAREERGISRTWRPVISRMDPADAEEHTVAGTHLSCITDHLQETAEALSESLSRAGGRPAAGEPG